VKSLHFSAALLGLGVLGAAPALAQTDRLPLPPSAAMPGLTFAEAYRGAGRPVVAVVDFYTPDAARPSNDLSAQARLLGARVREQLRSADVLMIPDDAAARAGSDAAFEALASVDATRAAQLVGEQTRADVVVVVMSEASTGADSGPRLQARAVAVDVRRGTTLGQLSYDIAPAAGRAGIDADRVSTFASIIVADAQQRFAGGYRGSAPAARVQTSAYNQPLASYSEPVARTVSAPEYVQQPTYVRQDTYVQQPVVARPVYYSAPVVVREPVYVQEPVYVPTSSWAVSVGYGWENGSVGFGYGSPGYCAPAYRPAYRSAYCGPRYSGWGGWNSCGPSSSVAFSIGWGGGYGGYGRCR